MSNAASHRFPTHNATDQGTETLNNAFRKIAQATMQVQEAMRMKEERVQAMVEEALRLSEEKMRERIEEAKRMMERKTQEKIDTALKSLEGKMRRNIQQMEVRMEQMERKLSSLEEKEKNINSQRASARIEERVQALETSVQKALVSVFPKVDALLNRMGGNRPASKSPAESVSANTLSSAIASTTTPDSSSVRSATVSTKSLFRSSISRGHLSDVPRDSTVPERQYLLDIVEAAKQNKLQNVSYLLNNGISVNFRDDNEATALHSAVLNGHREVAQLLIRTGANMSDQDKDGWTPLHYASTRHNNGPCISLLIEEGANVNAKTHKGNTPLHVATQRSIATAVQALLAAGAGAERNKEGKTPLQYVTTKSFRRLFEH